MKGRRRVSGVVSSTMQRTLRLAVTQGVTLLGAFFGFLALVWAPADPYAAAIAIVAASLCDMVDGRIARALGTQSAFGAELDSLADVISFGVAPAFLIYVWAIAPPGDAGFDPMLLLVFAFAACSALRLARFNVGPGTSSPYHIQGLSTPVAALVPTTLVMAWHEIGLDFLRHEWLLIGVLAAMSGLMVSRYPFPSFKKFRTRPRQIAYFGTMVAGLTLLALGGPGGTVLLGLLAIYFTQAAVEGVWRRRRGPD